MEDTYCLWQMSDKHKNCFIRIFFIHCLERAIVVDYKSFVFATVVVVVVAVAVVFVVVVNAPHTEDY